jgi:hypothetical protein
MKKRKVHKKKTKYKIVFIIAILLIISFVKQFYTTDLYRMELFLKKPSGEEAKIRECSSKIANFECTQTYNECSEPGDYYSRALTYFKGNLINDTCWQLIYVCPEQVGKTEEVPEQFKIAIYSPLNQTYYTKNIILNVSSNFLASEVFRSIDNSPNIMECMNCTGFTRYSLIFPDGAHIIKAYARDFENRVVEASVVFTVQL